MGEAISVNSALRATRKCRKRFAGGNKTERRSVLKMCVRMEECSDACRNESDSGRGRGGEGGMTAASDGSK